MRRILLLEGALGLMASGTYAWNTHAVETHLAQTHAASRVSARAAAKTKEQCIEYGAWFGGSGGGDLGAVVLPADKPDDTMVGQIGYDLQDFGGY